MSSTNSVHPCELTLKTRNRLHQPLAGFWVPWLPFAKLLRWSFAWWVAKPPGRVPEAIRNASPRSLDHYTAFGIPASSRLRLHPRVLLRRLLVPSHSLKPVLHELQLVLQHLHRRWNVVHLVALVVAVSPLGHPPVAGLELLIILF